MDYLYKTIVFLLVCGLYGLYLPERKQAPVENIEIRPEQPEFLLSETPDSCLMEALEYYGVQQKEIVYAQAILETGHFRSRLCKECNNLFGLYDSYKGQYYSFNHWSESIMAYLRYIQYKYRPPDDYYEFLEKIHYAEDPHYISKLKDIVKRYE